MQMETLFSVSRRLLCNFHQTRRVWNRHLCFRNLLSSSRYANVVLSSLLDLGSATGHFFVIDVVFLHKQGSGAA